MLQLTSTFEDNSRDGDGGGGESSVLPVRTAAAVQGGFVTVAFIYYTVEHGDAHEWISNHPLFPHCLLLPPEVQSAALLIG